MKTILIVDDNADLCRNLSNILEGEGYRTISTGNGRQAIQEVRAKSCDLVLLDIKLPDMDGMKVLDKIKKINKRLVIIMFTACGDVKGAVRAMKLGAFDYLTKPFDKEELVLIIKRAFHVRYLSAEREKKEELKATLNELKRTQVQLLQSGKMAAVGQLAAGVAHELNNPLGGILGVSEILLSEVPDQNPWKKDIEVINRSAQRCKTVISNMLGFAKRQEFSIQSAKICQVIDETLNWCQNQIKISNVRIVKRYDDNLPPVEVSVPHIQQVFLNLILNGLDAMPGGGVLTVSASSTNKSEVQVAFSDMGKGISKEHLTRIFDAFFTTKKADQGIGLGLSLCYSIVERHGGRIKAESDGPGRGAKFIVTIPAGDGETS